MASKSTEKASGILSYFTRHRTAANLLLMLLLVLGAAAIPNMRAQFFPDVIVESVDVSIVWEGAGPEDVDSAIVQALEPALLAVDGVEDTRSSSREGRAVIDIDFEPGWDMARATDDVQNAVDAVTTLPEDAEDPEVERAIWRDRVTDIVITGPVGAQQLGLLADELILRLFEVGVTRTTIRGVAAPRTIVEVPSSQLIAHDITMAEIASVIAAEVEINPAGEVEGANARVRTGTQKRTPEELEAVVLRSETDGSALTIGDVATIRVDGVDRQRSYFVGDNRAMSIRVDRSDQGDAIKIQRQVEDVVAEMNLSLPQGGGGLAYSHPRRGNHRAARYSGRQRADGPRAGGDPAVFVPQCPHCILGRRWHPGGHVCRHCADVYWRADDQYDLAFWSDYHAGDRGG